MDAGLSGKEVTECAISPLRKVVTDLSDRKALSNATDVNDITDWSDECGYLLFNNIDSTGQYLPEGMTGPDGKAIHDASGYRHGQPKEVEACGGSVGSKRVEQDSFNADSRDSNSLKTKRSKKGSDEKHRGWRRRRRSSW